jgi:tetratricopeptide (TPR) repeat protein
LHLLPLGYRRYLYNDIVQENLMNYIKGIGLCMFLAATMWAQNRGMPPGFPSQMPPEGVASAQTPSSPAERLVAEGDALRDAADYDAAIEHYTKALTLELDSTRILVRRATVYMTKSDNESALADVARVVKIDPKGPDAFIAYSMHGQLSLQKGDFTAAIKDYSSAIEMRPKDDPSYYWRGKAKQGKGDLKDALADFDMAVSMIPNSASYRLARGIAREDAKNFDGAIEDLDVAIRFTRGNSLAYFHRAEVQCARGKLDEAIADYDSAIKNNPQYALAYARRGVTKFLQRKDTEAQQDCDRAVELDPSLKSHVPKWIKEAKGKRDSGSR